MLNTRHFSNIQKLNTNIKKHKWTKENFNILENCCFLNIKKKFHSKTGDENFNRLLI